MKSQYVLLPYIFRMIYFGHGFRLKPLMNSSSAQHDFRELSSGVSLSFNTNFGRISSNTIIPETNFVSIPRLLSYLNTLRMEKKLVSETFVCLNNLMRM